ncbi:hypothetical protein AMELA_G00032750 [Ameiurus melas]|uniref:Uncharacterized protein n=1 Tax=Ameiurus melas TaxID=219545 RepID=A0A7J6B7I5_AMEME|nr:hypothetical protein AMELA_G00032750 [Ameiurus melas]
MRVAKAARFVASRRLFLPKGSSCCPAQPRKLSRCPALPKGSSCCPAQPSLKPKPCPKSKPSLSPVSSSGRPSQVSSLCCTSQGSGL